MRKQVKYKGKWYFVDDFIHVMRKEFPNMENNAFADMAYQCMLYLEVRWLMPIEQLPERKLCFKSWG